MRGEVTRVTPRVPPPLADVPHICLVLIPYRADGSRRRASGRVPCL